MLKRTMGLVLSALLLTGCSAGNTPYGEFLLASPLYPQMAQYPDEESFIGAGGVFDSEGFQTVYKNWSDDRAKQSRYLGTSAEGLTEFYIRTMQTFLTDTQGENRLYSPLNLFLALSMLAEITGGDSREQILSLLQTETIDQLRERVTALWNAHYCNDGSVTSVLANSLWLNEGDTYNSETLRRLAEVYYASSFRGEMGSEAYTRAFQTWLDEQTGGLLTEATEEIKISPETVLLLASTVFYQAKWANPFLTSNTTEESFFLAAGGEMTCDFMHRSESGLYYWEDNFSAVFQGLNESGGMWFLLPDEGVSPESLLQDPKTMEFLFGDPANRNSKYLVVNLSVPKFDVTSDLRLEQGLQELGITKVFHTREADFSPISERDDLFLGAVDHAVRVAVDEDGCTAAAYTAMRVCGAAMPPEEEVDFVLNRPFLFVITADTGVPLFVGIVHRPVQ